MSSQRNNFDNIALKYSESVDTKPIHIYYERPSLISLLPDCIENLKILDLGCGSGWYCEYLTNKGAIVTSIDSSPTMVNITQKRVKEAQVILADLNEPLDFLPDSAFDIIIAPLTIHYIKNWTPLFQELSKKIKVKGSFVFSTNSPYIEYALFNLENYFEKVKIIDEWENIGKVEFYHHTLNELSTALSTSHFMIANMLEPQPLPEMQAAAPKMYANLISKPWFLFIKAIKVEKLWLDLICASICASNGL